VQRASPDPSTRQAAAALSAALRAQPLAEPGDAHRDALGGVLDL
jgi:hypothetical protein